MKRKKNGFTLIEILVVICVVAVIAVIVWPFITKSLDEANNKMDKVVKSNVIEAVNMYSVEYDNQIDWNKNGAGIKNACVPLSVLIDKGYLKNNEKVSPYISYDVKVVQNNGINYYSFYTNGHNKCVEEHKNINLLSIAALNNGNYKKGDEITIEVAFDDIVHAANLTELNSANAPKLKYRFGTSTIKEAQYLSHNSNNIIYKIIVDINDYGKLAILNLEGTVSNEYNTLALRDKTIEFSNNIIAKTIAKWNENYYFSLADAFRVATNNSTITIVNSGEDSSSTIASAKIINLDLNGKTITCNDSPYIIENNGTLTILDSKTNGALKNNVGNGVNNNRTLIINNGTIESTSMNGIYNNVGTITINNGIVKGAYAVYNNGSGTISINNGSIAGTSNGVYNANGTLTINNGEIRSSSIGINNISGTVNMVNGIVNGNSVGIQTNTGDVTITNGTITSTITGIKTNTGVVVVNGGNITGNTQGVYSSGNNNITIGSASATLSTTLPRLSGGQYGVYMSSSAYKFNFNSGLISGTASVPYIGSATCRSGYQVSTTSASGYYNTTLTKIPAPSSGGGGGGGGGGCCGDYGTGSCNCTSSNDVVTSLIINGKQIVP